MSILLLLLCSGFQFGEFQEIPKTVRPVFDLIEKLHSSNGYGRESIIADTYEEITNDFEKFDDLTMTLNNFITNRFPDFPIDIDTLPVKREIEQLQSQFSLHMVIIKEAVADIRRAIEQVGIFLGTVGEYLVEKHYDKVLKSVEDIQMHLAPFEYEDKADEKKKMGLVELYELLTTKNILHRCGTGTSPQQVLLELYVAIMKTETVAMEALILLTSLKNVDDTAWTTLAKRFALRYNAYVHSFTRAFDKAAREHRSCDPDKEIGWGRDTSFFELVQYHQAVAFHRSGSVAKRFLWPNCNSWIDTIMNKDYFDKCESSDSEACWMEKRERCYGTLHNCFHTSTPRCIIHELNYPRRYLWIGNAASSEAQDNPNPSCPTNVGFLHEGLGDTCICHCVERENIISLDLSLSDIAKNRVITAMRFARRDKIVFIQIKQGTLQSDGKIAAESTLWQPHWPSHHPDKFFMLNSLDQGINLDDLHGADDEVLTGIGFARSDGDPDNRVKLQIIVTKFNYTEGQLSNQSRVIAASDEKRMQERLQVNNPLNSQLENVPTTLLKDTSKRFITFEQSDLMSDAGQTTLPLFDAVPVEGQPPSPLGGAGIFHKKTPNYAGFLSIRAIGINVAKYFKEGVKPLALDPEAKFEDLSTFLKSMEKIDY